MMKEQIAIELTFDESSLLGKLDQLKTEMKELSLKAIDCERLLEDATILISGFEIKNTASDGADSGAG